MKTIGGVVVTGRRVLVRADLNVPLVYELGPRHAAAIGRLLPDAGRTGPVLRDLRP